MEKDVMQLFGGTVALQNNIVPMMQSFLGGKTAANGMQGNVFRDGIPHPPMSHPPPPRYTHQLKKLFIPSYGLLNKHP